MKYLRIVQTTTAFIPFVWFILFISILVVGTIHLGYVPEYGNHIDPYALQIDFLFGLHIFFFTLAIIFFISWMVISFISMNKTGKSINNKTSFILLVISCTGFLLFRFVFTSYFLWVFD